ncbi:glycogen synthase, partial [Candidatus Margulisiibacteriota bacterium]
MKILFTSSEVAPFAKTGGLADVAGALPKALQALGHDVRVVMPAYKSVKAGEPLPRALAVSLNGTSRKCNLNRTTLPDSNVPVYLIDYKKYYDRDELYQAKGVDYPDNAERFAFYSLAALEMVKQQDWSPDIIHCNDWQTALIPAYLNTRYKEDSFFNKTATVFTIHNLAYQGLARPDKITHIGLDPMYYSPDYLEFYGKLNLMKSGLLFSDIINTVSKRYSKEMQTPEFGCGLEGILAQRKEDVFGIINGLDYDTWDPQSD